MIHKKLKPESLGAPFKGKKPGPDVASSAMLIKALSNNDSEVRMASVRGLSLLCFAYLGEPNDTSLSLLRLFEYHARYSQHSDVRMGCIDALAECRDTCRLKSLTFEIGSEDTRQYRNGVLSRLVQEIS
jgi:hypothetical protein